MYDLTMMTVNDGVMAYIHEGKITVSSNPALLETATPIVLGSESPAEAIDAPSSYPSQVASSDSGVAASTQQPSAEGQDAGSSPTDTSPFTVGTQCANDATRAT